MKKEWLEFEKAVALFIKAWGPNLKVQHNVRMPDKDTKALRQRDVWVEFSVAKIIPIKILISCKRLKRPLNEMDIDHFKGEFDSSGADKGVIYSYSGFNSLAIKKADNHGFSCMQLFSNQPPTIPDILMFKNTYIFKPHFYLKLLTINDPNCDFHNWNDLFDLDILVDKKHIILIDYICNIFYENEERIINEMNRINSPENWAKKITLKTDNGEFLCELDLAEYWDAYCCNLNAQLVNGSYNFSDKIFAGSISFKANFSSADPGDGWSRVEGSFSLANSLSFVQRGLEIKETIIEVFGSRKLEHCG